MALLFGFQRGTTIGQVSIILLIVYGTYEKPGWWRLKFPDARQLPSNRSFTITLAVLAFFTLWLLSTHIIQESNGSFTTGESS
jgi:phosphotransferase system  glucose/maltose/N-acetylglucosamine-specific IIC component